MDTISRAAELIGFRIGVEQLTPEATVPKHHGFVGKAYILTKKAGTFEGTYSSAMVRRWVAVIREGFPVETVQHIVDSGRLNPVEVDRVVLPRKTWANRKKAGKLTAEQSDRLLRVARVIATAEEVFGDKDKAGLWLRRPTTALDGERPLELLDTEEGAREVETLLTRISHGIAA